MQPELTFASAFLVGLFGSVHCIGFCRCTKTQLQKPATRRLAGGLIVVLAGISLVCLGFNLSGTGQHDHTQIQHIH